MSNFALFYGFLLLSEFHAWLRLRFFSGSAAGCDMSTSLLEAITKLWLSSPADDLSAEPSLLRRATAATLARSCRPPSAAAAAATGGSPPTVLGQRGSDARASW